MRFDVFSLFPEVFQPYLEISILKRAIANGLIDVQTHNIRDWATDRHHTTDDTPYGGGGGMVMKPEPVFGAVESVLGAPPSCPVIMLSPQGELFNQTIARELATYEHLALLCGRYEGFDERIREHLATRVISIGDYVLTGGELPALIVMDAVARLQPGVLGDREATDDDSFSSDGLLEYPQWTKPAEFRGWSVPEVMQQGNLGEQLKWKRQQSLIRTWKWRPDLLEKANLSDKDRKFLKKYLEDSATDRSGL
ncbi:MAG: tRNA (guanosine(37)-N1)-methyltransferase TrmD [Anaerolineaceae bacterium]|jgi:tRNA (guanine37-N1)-methyltransferase|nr:tRNA (guanosine(37)-N1)-methyltransferase TrmD [Anaerolineaceae bacterium]MDD4043017.1 tRNA (guanosine(37)-N1)-methyltransferase TrmD [Anaerolineaceae bacterium]MDD4577305.1 tRNA (guanosine(37)-N1)-methyltransferase TrmD [Anaerolineaceae bacterium]